MKKESCTSYPSCPPCFGRCNTPDAPYDMDSNRSCDGCETCRKEKEKEYRGTTKIDTVISQLYKDGAIKREALSILYVENIISKGAFYELSQRALLMR